MLQCGPCEAARLYERRHCQRHPKSDKDLVKIAPAWTPQISMEGKIPVTVRGYYNRECPTSYITAESIWILDLVDSNGLAWRDAGATLFGSDLRKHPAWWLDALTAIASAKADYERAEMESRK